MKSWTTAAVRILTVLGLSLAWTAFGAEAEATKLPSKFSLKGISGKTLSQADFKSDVTVVQFWASWCFSCSTTMRDLSKWSNGKRGVKFVQVSVDEKMSDAEGYFDGKNASLGYLKKTSFLDPEGRIAAKLGVQSIPTVLVVGKDGIVLKTIVGHPNSKDMKDFDRLVLKSQG